MSSISIPLPDLYSTKKLAHAISDSIENPACITLQGDLGAGKTTFSQFFITSLSEEPVEVTSPTFTLVQNYDSTKGPIWHYDMYRLDHEGDVIELALDDALDMAITLIEWPERIPSYLPQDRLDITLTFDKDNDNARHASIKGYGKLKPLVDNINLDME